MNVAQTARCGFPFGPEWHAESSLSEGRETVFRSAPAVLLAGPASHMRRGKFVVVPSRIHSTAEQPSGALFLTLPRLRGKLYRDCLCGVRASGGAGLLGASQHGLRLVTAFAVWRWLCSHLVTMRESNPLPPDYSAGALPSELIVGRPDEGFRPCNGTRCGKSRLRHPATIERRNWYSERCAQRRWFA